MLELGSVKAQQLPAIKVLVFWVCKLAHWRVLMLLTLTTRGVEPALMVLSGVLGSLLTRDDVVLGRKKIIEADKHEEQICCYVAFVLLIEHPFLAAALNGFDLNSDTLCCVGVRCQYVNALCVPKSQRRNVAAT